MSRFQGCWPQLVRVVSFALGVAIALILALVIDTTRLDLALLSLTLMGYPALPLLARAVGAAGGADETRDRR